MNIPVVMKIGGAIATLFLISSMLLSGCSVTVPQQEYDAMKAERDTLVTERDAAVAELNTAHKEIDDLRKERDSALVQVEDLQDEQDATEAQIASLQDQRDTILAEIVELQAQRDLDQAQIESLQEQLDISNTSTASNGWEQSYKAGYTDSNGHYAGGSEILHIVNHNGKLYAAVSYWMDPRNIWYGGKDASTGWGQIIRLDKPGGKWEVDLEMGPQYLRPEIVKSVTFTMDGKANLLKEPVQLLVTSTYCGDGSGGVDFWVRNDTTGLWDKGHIIPGPTGKTGEENSVRDVRVYRDKVTGQERIFISIGVFGIYSGIYNPAAPGKIRWDNKSESGPVDTRPLAIIEANGALYFSAGSKIYKRNDGPSPTYTMVYDADTTVGVIPVSSPSGGIRGMSPVPNPKGKRESLLFCWVPDSTASIGNVYRLDPDGKGSFTSTREVCLADLMSDYLNGNPVYFVLAAYSEIMPVVDPSTKETVHIIGFEAWIGGSSYPTIQRGPADGGFYAGGMYAIRDKNGNYRLNEINGPITPDKPVLQAVRTYMLSPFEGEKNLAIYFGGIDCNWKETMHDTAWIFAASLETALRKDAPKAKRMN